MKLSILLIISAIMLISCSSGRETIQNDPIANFQPVNSENSEPAIDSSMIVESKESVIPKPETGNQLISRIEIETQNEQSREPSAKLQNLDIKRDIAMYEENNPHLRESLLNCLTAVTKDSMIYATPASTKDSAKIKKIILQRVAQLEKQLSVSKDDTEKYRLMKDIEFTVNKFTRKYPKLSIGYGNAKINLISYLQKYPYDLAVRIWDSEMNMNKYLIFHY